MNFRREYIRRTRNVIAITRVNVYLVYVNCFFVFFFLFRANSVVNKNNHLGYKGVLREFYGLAVRIPCLNDCSWSPSDRIRWIKRPDECNNFTRLAVRSPSLYWVKIEVYGKKSHIYNNIRFVNTFFPLVIIFKLYIMYGYFKFRLCLSNVVNRRVYIYY